MSPFPRSGRFSVMRATRSATFARRRSRRDGAFYCLLEGRIGAMLDAKLGSRLEAILAATRIFELVLRLASTESAKPPYSPHSPVPRCRHRTADVRRLAKFHNAIALLFAESTKTRKTELTKCSCIETRGGVGADKT